MVNDNKATIVTSARRAAIIPAIFTIACLVPFVNKAFHMDDPLFLWTARQIQINPVDFYGFPVTWYESERPMAAVTQNPPLASYYIALVASLFGWSEVTMHIAFLIPAAAAALGTYYLAERLCSRPALAALAAVLTPGFLISSTNIMCDTMMLAFWVWAVFLWVRGIESDGYLTLFFAATLVGICALTKYYGTALLPLLLVYSLVKKRKVGMWLLPLLVPILILGGYQWITHNLYGRGLLTNAATYAIKRSLPQGAALFSKGLTGLLFAGGCIATVLFYSPLLWSRRILICSVALTILFVLTLSMAEKIGTASIRDKNGVRWAFLVQAGLMAAGGVGILTLTGADFLKSRTADSLLLLLWVFGTFTFAAFINWTVNSRSVLPIAPAIGILLMRRIDRCGTGLAHRIRTWRAAWPLAPAAAVALLVCWADYTWANSARSAAATIQETFKDSQHTVWFQGHWGFQYYMEAAGAKALDFERLEIAPADTLIVPLYNCNGRRLARETVYLDRVFRFPLSRTFAIMRLGAGFYSDVWGPLPFVAPSPDSEPYLAFTVR